MARKFIRREPRIDRTRNSRRVERLGDSPHWQKGISTAAWEDENYLVLLIKPDLELWLIAKDHRAHCPVCDMGPAEVIGRFSNAYQYETWRGPFTERMGRWDNLDDLLADLADWDVQCRGTTMVALPEPPPEPTKSEQAGTLF